MLAGGDGDGSGGVVENAAPESALGLAGSEEGATDQDGVAQGLAADGAGENGLRVDRDHETVRRLLHADAFSKKVGRWHKQRLSKGRSPAGAPTDVTGKSVNLLERRNTSRHLSCGK